MYATSHRPNARYAPAAFVGGALNLDIAEPFSRLTNRTLVICGAKAPMGATNAMAFAEANPYAKIETVADAGLLPHDEKADWFNVTVGDFLQ
jgi:pimeloyl-ACP methyl ester carboxylesterase